MTEVWIYEYLYIDRHFSMALIKYKTFKFNYNDMCL